ncbi:unnamed protein product [Meloidogyne enterolobii]|uniref:Uncharacterized protein n=1 Tax=Meloidogyne enterolobii TaxID=390850 RepID=A0ACB1A5V2_MELEN
MTTHQKISVNNFWHLKMFSVNSRKHSTVRKSNFSLKKKKITAKTQHTHPKSFSRFSRKMSDPERYSPEALYQLLETTNKNVLNLQTDVTKLRTDFDNNKKDTTTKFENISRQFEELQTTLTNHNDSSKAGFEAIGASLVNHMNACTSNFEMGTRTILRLDRRLNYMRQSITGLSGRMENLEMNNNQNIPGNAGVNMGGGN